MEEFVRQAIRLAYASAKKGDDPFAALLVKDCQVVATSLDESVSRCDPTAHAELALIRDYCSSQKFFSLEGLYLSQQHRALPHVLRGHPLVQDFPSGFFSLSSHTKRF
jgi:tRNA(Arg) A34 adenosine deaminase TadA